ncbi:MAG: hypothetical protein HQL19_05555 [Candidatus Omnitrophica bacterium]|nr:hypothetical protein [Candidatus Omnitrophota bacterium]
MTRYFSGDVVAEAGMVSWPKAAKKSAARPAGAGQTPGKITRRPWQQNGSANINYFELLNNYFNGGLTLVANQEINPSFFWHEASDDT